MGKVGVRSLWRRTALLCNLPFSEFPQHHPHAGSEGGGVRLLEAEDADSNFLGSQFIYFFNLENREKVVSPWKPW